VTVPVGNYSATQLVDVLNAEFSAELLASSCDSLSSPVKCVVDELWFADIGITWGYSSRLGKVTVTSTHALTLEHTLIGFGTQTTIAANALGVAPNVLDLSGPQCIYVHSNFHLGNIDSHHKGPANTLVKVPVNEPPGHMLSHAPELFRQHINDHNIGSINLRLHDEDMVPLNLNGGNWSITLQLDYAYKKKVVRHRQLKHARIKK
jgi:hypothetical protein